MPKKVVPFDLVIHQFTMKANTRKMPFVGLGSTFLNFTQTCKFEMNADKHLQDKTIARTNGPIRVYIYTSAKSQHFSFSILKNKMIMSCKKYFTFTLVLLAFITLAPIGKAAGEFNT